MPLDITINKTTVHEVKAAICKCPYCGRDVRPSQRVNYPAAAVGAFATVYRCLCGKFIGAPVSREVG